MQPEEQLELIDHLEEIFRSIGLTIMSTIQYAQKINGKAPLGHDETVAIRSDVNNCWKLLGRRIANFAIWIDNDEPA